MIDPWQIQEAAERGTGGAGTVWMRRDLVNDIIVIRWNFLDRDFEWCLFHFTTATCPFPEVLAEVEFIFHAAVTATPCSDRPSVSTRNRGSSQQP